MKPMIQYIEYEQDGEQIPALVTNFPKEDGSDFFTSDDAPAMVISNNKQDTKKRYITWGSDNKLPLHIIAKAYKSCYIAPSLKHLTDSTFSAGIKAYFVYYVYHNGEMTRKQIDYEAAGEWLRARIRELKAEQTAAASTAWQNVPVTPPDNSEEIAKLEKDLKTWEDTSRKWQTFIENNDINNFLMEQAADATYFWNWFPMIDLNIGEEGKEWKPEIKLVTHMEATNTRVGEMNEYGDITYCVYSRRFGEEGENMISSNPDAVERMTVIDALTPSKALRQLRAKVEAQKKNKLKSRTTRYILPMRMPSPGKPYYAEPTYWSIFKSGIYYYMIALFQRRAYMMDNATMFGRIVHLDQEYLNYAIQQSDYTGPDKEVYVYNQLVNEIQKFLKNPKNNGKALITFTKSIDGKQVKWITVETIESPMKGSDVKEDIGEIANIMLFSIGIHPQTVGAIPGKDKVASGTEARELNTLQQVYLLPLKLQLLKPFYLSKDFNRWDRHLYFDIPPYVLTTLDKNPQGVQEMKQ